MKNLKYIFLLLLPILGLNSCTNDDASNPNFGDDEIYLYGEWSRSHAKKINQTLEIDGLMASPSEGATYKWTIDGEVISNKKDLSFDIKEYYLGAILKYEVTNANGKSSYREASLIVAKDFEPKEYEKMSVGYITKDGAITDIDWQNITHLIYAGVSVPQSNGNLDIKNDIDMSTMIAYAHHYGVYAIMDVNGVLGSYLNSAPAYASYTFYQSAIANPIGLATKIVTEAKTRGFDGINITMDKASEDGAFADNVNLKKFYEEVGNQLKSEKNDIDGKQYDYLASMSAWSGWTRGSIYPFVNLPQYDWVNVLAYGNENTEPQEHSGQWFSENEIEAWMTTWIGPVAADRLVLVTPAFGLRYFGKPSGYNWGNLWQFTEYLSYDAICKANAEAHNQDKVFVVDYTGNKDVDVNVTYYNGLPAAKSRAEFAVSKGLAGVGLWSLESDSKESVKSLIKQINTSLGN